MPTSEPTRLADLTTLRLGGPAARIVEATTTQQLVDTVRSADAAGEPVLVVGGGSNLVVGDDGWPGAVVLVRTTDVLAATDDGEGVGLTVDAGHPWDALVAMTVDEGWSGLATLSGIPGLTGATPVQNVGAYGWEVADFITGLSVLDRTTGAVEQWPAERCGFGFRTSAFKHTDRYVVLTVTFGLRVTPQLPVRYAELARRLDVEPGETASSTRIRKAVLELRRSKGMVLDAADHDTWSVGSFFVNPFVPENLVPDGCPHWQVDGAVKLSAAWLIEQAGFGKGFTAGSDRVSISTKHALALTNRGDASTRELLELAAVVRDGVEQRFGVRLRPEAHLVGVEF